MITKAKISKGGKIIIPIILRKKLALEEGEEILFELQEDKVVMSSLKYNLKKARQIINHYHPASESLVEKLMTQRREEATHEG